MANEKLITKQLSIYSDANFYGGEYPIEIEVYKGTEEYNYLFLSAEEAKALRDFLNQHIKD